jgi:hypothetical protein
MLEYWNNGTMGKKAEYWKNGMMTDHAKGECGSNIIPPFQYSIIPDFGFFYD